MDPKPLKLAGADVGGAAAGTDLFSSTAPKKLGFPDDELVSAVEATGFDEAVNENEVDSAGLEKKSDDAEADLGKAGVDAAAGGAGAGALKEKAGAGAAGVAETAAGLGAGAKLNAGVDVGVAFVDGGEPRRPSRPFEAEAPSTFFFSSAAGARAPRLMEGTASVFFASAGFATPAAGPKLNPPAGNFITGMTILPRSPSSTVGRSSSRAEKILDDAVC